MLSRRAGLSVTAGLSCNHCGDMLIVGHKNCMMAPVDEGSKSKTVVRALLIHCHGFALFTDTATLRHFPDYLHVLTHSLAVDHYLRTF